ASGLLCRHSCRHSSTRLVDCPEDFYSMAGTAPLLSRLGLFRKRCRIMALDRKPIRAATVMERFRRRYRSHRDSPLVQACLLLYCFLQRQPDDKLRTGRVRLDPDLSAVIEDRLARQRETQT